MSLVTCQVRLPRQRCPLSLLSRLIGKPHRPAAVHCAVEVIHHQARAAGALAVVLRALLELIVVVEANATGRRSAPWG